MGQLTSIHQFLAMLQDVKPSGQDKWMALCPGHEDKKTRSLSIRHDGNKILIHCFAGCQLADILSPLELVPGDLSINTEERRKKEQRKIVSVYDYGEFEVVRFEPKTFLQRRPDGKGGWIWNTNGITPCLYHKDEVLQAVQDGSEIYICEGEKDADNLRAIGLVATTCPRGAGKWRSEYTETLKEAKSIVILPDNDDPGRKHAQAVAKALDGAVLSIKIVELPDLLPKGDVSDWLAAGGDRIKLDLIVYNAPEWELDSKTGPGDIGKTPRYASYVVINGEPCHMRSSKEDGVYPARLANFDARITRVLIHDNGVTQTPYYEIVGTIPASSTDLPAVLVSLDEFYAMSWLKRWPLARVEAGMGMKDHLRSYLQGTITDFNPRYVFTHSGWREIDGQMIYLSNSGALDDENIEVELDRALERYRLPANPDEVPAKDAIRASLSFMDFGSPDTMIPLYASMYLAPLYEILEPNFILWLAGKTGSFKSALTALALNHFGMIDRPFNDEHLPTQWQAWTKMRLLEMAFAAKDLPLVIDNWMPGSSRDDQKDLDKKAHGIIHAIGDHAARGRFSGGRGSLDTLPPRGMILSTGEQLPDVESTQGRLFIVRVLPDEVEASRLSQAQTKESPLYCYAMCHYLRTMAMDYKDISVRLVNRFQEVRGWAADATQHRRLPSAVAYLYTAFEYAMDVFLQLDAIDYDEHLTRCWQAWDVLVSTASRQAEAMIEQRPAYRFVNTLKTLIEQKRAILINKDFVDLAHAHKEIKQHQSWLGWEDSEYIYLIPDISYTVVSDFCSRGHGVPIGKKHSVWEDLRLSGWIIGSSDKTVKAGIRNTNRVQVGDEDNKALPTVIKLRRDVLSDAVIPSTQPRLTG